MDEIQQRAQAYGVRMEETLSTDEITSLRESVDHSSRVRWTDPNLRRVLRLRLVGYNHWEYPSWDVSYCYGELADGTRCLVDLPFHRLGGNWKANIVAEAIEDGVFAKGLGLLDESVVSRLWG